MDIAHERGATDAAIVELWRPLTVKHPVTGASVSDRFLIGRLKLTQVRDALSLARAEGKLARAAQTGDVVILRLAKAPDKPVTTPTAATPAQSPTSKAVEQPPPAPPVCAETGAGTQGCDDDTRIISELFEGLRGQNPRTRILAYEGYVKRRPQGRYAVVLYEEAQQLRKLVGLLSSNEPVEVAPSKRSFEAPGEALAGTALTFGIELDDAVGAVLHSRHAGEVAYVSTPMQPAGDGYFNVIVPAERVRARRLEYFIEATTPSGRALEVVGTASLPFMLSIAELPVARPPKRRSAVIS